MWGRKRTLAGQTVYKNGSIDTSFFDLPPFSLDSTFNSCPVNILQTLISLYCLWFPGQPVYDMPIALAMAIPLSRPMHSNCKLRTAHEKPYGYVVSCRLPASFYVVFNWLHLPPVRFHRVKRLNPSNVGTFALTVRRSNHLLRSLPNLARSHLRSARTHLRSARSHLRSARSHLR